MRPTANFTLHAILAACLAALATSSAAAARPVTDNEGHAVLTMQLLGSGATGRSEEVEILSFHWGPRQSTSADGSRTRTGNLISLDDNPGAIAAASHEVKSPRDSSLGSASERRQHKPATVIKENDTPSALPVTEKRQHGWVTVTKPLERGSLRVEGSMPGCAVGAAYPGAVLQTASARYELKEVIVSSCAINSVSLDYAKVTVRGWDPAPKK